MKHPLLFALLFLLTSFGTAQQMMRLEAATSLMIAEIGTVISFENERLVVRFIPPADRRPAGMEKVDVAQGDVVGMINGKRISGIAELRKAYDTASVGSEVKLGLRRDGRPHIITFAKKDRKDLPQGMRIVRGDGEGHDDNEDILPALGIIIRNENGKVVIAETLPNVSADFKKGDVITSLNSKPVKAVRDFSAAFDATEIGAALQIELLRAGETVSVTTPRPKPAGNVMMRNRN